MKSKTGYSGLAKLMLMVLLTFATQIVTLMKSSIVAGKFGVSAEMDAFNFANSLASFVFSFLISGISTIVIPCYVKKSNRRITDSFLSLILSATVIVVSLILIFRESIISSITGRDSEFVELTCSILVLLLLANFFTFFSSVTSAFFQYIEKYNLPKIISFISQCAVIFVLILAKNISIAQYTLIIGGGLLLNSIIDLGAAIKNGWRFRLSFALKNPETQALLKTFFPVLASTGVYQISLMIDNAIASRLNTGDITVLNYANQITAMINTLLVGNILAYFYPKMVKDIVDEKPQQCFWDKTIFFHAIICLLIVGYVTIGKEGLSILFEHGKFGEESTNTVYVLGMIYIIALQANVVRDMIYRYFYSLRDTKSTTLNSIIATAVNIVTSLFLVKFIGIYGIVIGTAISSVISLISIINRFTHKVGKSGILCKTFLQYLRTILLSIVSICIVLYSKRIIAVDNMFLSIVLFGVESILIYLLLTLLANRKIVKISLQI